MIFTNGRLVCPDGVRDGLEILESGGKICGIREAGNYPEPEAFDLERNYIAPGFIDLHVHGALGRDTMEGSVDAFRAICDYHASGGTTSLLLTTTTAPISQIAEVLRSILRHTADLPQVAGVHVEGPFISKARAGAQQLEHIREPTAELLDELLEFAEIIERVTIAPEVAGALAAMDRLRAHEISISGGHSDAWEEDVRNAFEHGMRSVSHTFNCMSSARRRGVDRVAGLLEFALSEPEIVCELIADGHHVSTTLMKMLYRAKGAGGICLVTDATAGAGLPIDSRFKLGNVECVVAEGACWLADRSALAGSATRMIELVRRMVREVGVPLHEAIGMATANPACVIGLREKGTLEVGTDADFVVLSPDLEVLRTFCAGEKVFPVIS